MQKLTKDEVIRANESIKHSTAVIQEAVNKLAAQGRHEEAQMIETALTGLKKSLARLHVCEDGSIATVQ